jgi:23S rRNA (cytidine1920-2'-O)/16S rRNA (cytidine1409-2'-O)-methyltransferase
VVAVDVGRGQLDWRLRNDPRVIVREGINARRLAPVDLPHPIDVVTIDVSFISLRHIFPVLAPVLSHDGDIVALVKPQFEAGRHQVGKHGLVTDPVVHEMVLERVTHEADASGLVKMAMTASPIAGATGNREFFFHLRLRSG